MSNNNEEDNTLKPWFVQALIDRQQIPQPQSQEPTPAPSAPSWLVDALQHRSTEPAPNISIPNTSDEDYSLSVHWDEWRNALLYAIHCLICELWSTRPDIRVRRGATASYTCDITNLREITNVAITKKSGNAKLDQLIIQAIQSFDNAELLEFPRGSNRQNVSQAGGFMVGDAFSFDYTSFGDQEKVMQRLR